ncbi:MAG: hypothetical protein ABS36_18155 [Acidobacteria bacterium SCN 69-37]|nr:MAG: hypothetical protein ABS36_18155 [Acidobacteria bacterium SCN 69-37]
MSVTSQRLDAARPARGPAEIDPVRRAFVVPAGLRRELRDVMNQQCWCWGCDVRRPRGNLLMRHGAARVRPPGGDRRRSTAYHVDLGEGAWAALWGFGLAVVPARGLPVLMFRYEPEPRLILDATALRSVWSPADLPPHDAAKITPAWWSALTMFRWIASYEAWVLEHAGAAWRRQCVEQFKGVIVSGGGLAAVWDSIGDRLERAILDAVRTVSAS